MSSTTYAREPLTAYVGTAGADPEETPTGKATRFRFVTKDGFDDQATDKWFDVIVMKEPLRQAVKDHVYKGSKLAILGFEKRDDYNPEKPRYTIFPAQISTTENIKYGLTKSAPEDEF